VSLRICLACNHPLIYHDDLDGCDELMDTEDDSIAICKCRGEAEAVSDERTSAGWHPPGLRLGIAQERQLRRWPLERIKPKSVALGVRSLFAEIDALRAAKCRCRMTSGSGGEDAS